MKTLSKRENQILEMTAVGLSVDEIADELYISRETVRKTIANIKIKLGLQKVAELTAYYWCQKLGTTLEEERERILYKVEIQRQNQIRTVLAGSLASIFILCSFIEISEKRRSRSMLRRREDIEVVSLLTDNI